MEKWPMCRICLVQNDRMFKVVNRNLYELYEKLTDIPFVTDDRRPILACFFCCAKLKQCYRFMRQCLEAEELFAQMINEDYEPNPLINQDQLEGFSGFIKSPTVHISIGDECQTENIAIKEELPAVCERHANIIEPNEEHQSDELGPENLSNSCLEDEADIAHDSKSDLEDDVPLMEFKTEVEEEQDVSKKKRRARETEKLEPENLNNSCLEDESDIPAHDSKSDLEDDVPLMEFKTKVEEEHEVSKKNRIAQETKKATVVKKRKLETRGTEVEDAMTAKQSRKEESDTKVLLTTEDRSSKPGTCFKELYRCDQSSFKRVKIIQPYTGTHNDEKPYKCDLCQRKRVWKKFIERWH